MTTRTGRVGHYDPTCDRSDSRQTARSHAVVMPAFTLPDQGERPWSLADHLDAGVVIVSLRGDW